MLAVHSGNFEEPVMRLVSLNSIGINRSNPEQVRGYLHDILESYYMVSVKRFVDTTCQRVIDHLLLNGKDSPLHVFSTDLVFDLSADALGMIAGDNQATKREGERLKTEMERLEAAMLVGRGWTQIVSCTDAYMRRNITIFFYLSFGPQILSISCICSRWTCFRTFAIKPNYRLALLMNLALEFKTS